MISGREIVRGEKEKVEFLFRRCIRLTRQNRARLAQW